MTKKEQDKEIKRRAAVTIPPLKSDARFASPERMRDPSLFFRLQRTHSPVAAALEAEGFSGKRL